MGPRSTQHADLRGDYDQLGRTIETAMRMMVVAAVATVDDAGMASDDVAGTVTGEVSRHVVHVEQRMMVLSTFHASVSAAKFPFGVLVGQAIVAILVNQYCSETLRGTEPQ